MKIELESYDYYFEPSGQQAMMVANGHNGMHATHPFNLEENFLHILGKTHLIKYTHLEVPIFVAVENGYGAKLSSKLTDDE